MLTPCNLLKLDLIYCMERETKYVMFLRVYGTVNYLIAMAEQIALWHFRLHTFFWWALILNVLGVIGLGIQISKLEKRLGLS